MIGKIIGIGALIFVCFAGWRIGGMLSDDALGMVLGVIFGIMAGIPAALLAGGAVAEAEWAQGELIGGGDRGKVRSY